MAAIRGDVKQVKELIRLGANVNVKDFAGKLSTQLYKLKVTLKFLKEVSFQFMLYANEKV